MNILEKLKNIGSSLISVFFMGKKEKKVEEEKDFSKVLEEEAITSPSKQVLRNFVSNKLGMIGLVGFIIIVLVVFVGSSTLKYDPYYSQAVLNNIGPGSGYMDVPQELKDEGIKKISTGTTFSIGLSEKGKFYVWGHKPAMGEEIPEEAIKAQGKIKDVAAGDQHLLILTEDGEIIGWGNNSFNQAKSPSSVLAQLAGDKVKEIGAGDLYSVLLTESGTIKVWGATLPTRLNRISKKLDKKIDSFVASSVNILVKLKDGSMEVLGNKGSELYTSMPKELKDGSVKIDIFGRQKAGALAIDENGKHYLWGARADGVLNVPEFDGKVVKIASGRDHMTVLTDKNKVYSWGVDNYGTVKGQPEGDGYKDIFSGYFNTYAVKEDKSVDTWGLNGFIIGSDEQGRDLFTRLVNGGKMTLIIAFVSVLIQVVLGVLVGVIAGFYGGWVDNILMRFSEIVASFPFYPLIITLSAMLPVDASQYQRLIMIMVILGILGWTGIARLVRGEILSEREKDYITAAKALGLKESKIMVSHMIPNIMSIIIVQATLGYASNLLTEAGLSFLGFGVKDPYPSWGNMLSNASELSVLELYWWRWVFPGLAVFITALTVNLIGDALRDAMDPKAQER